MRKSLERSKSIDEVRLFRVLAGELETTVLTAAEKAVWSERFLAKMSEPGPGEEAFFAGLRKSGKASVPPPPQAAMISTLVQPR